MIDYNKINWDVNQAFHVTRYRFREAGLKKNTMSAAVRERTTTHTSRKLVSHGGPISGQRDGAATASSLENNLGKPLNVPPEL